MIRKWTNPTQKVIVKGADLSQAKVFVTFRQDCNVLTIEDPTAEYDGEDTTLYVPLEQIQTGSFNTSYVNVQVNWVAGDKRYATDIAPVRLTPNLLPEEVEI